MSVVVSVCSTGPQTVSSPGCYKVGSCGPSLPGVELKIAESGEVFYRSPGSFVEYYNNQRYHESLSNVTPADAYFGRAPAIIQQRERIKRKTIAHRRLQHRKLAA